MIDWCALQNNVNYYRLIKKIIYFIPHIYDNLAGAFNHGNELFYGTTAARATEWNILASNMTWRCFICYVFVALSLRQLLSHINTMHSRSPDFRVVCGIDGCPSEYRVYNSFYYHVKRTHARHLLGVEADEEDGSTRHGLPGAGERTAPINQTNASSSVTDEGSSIPALTVSYFNKSQRNELQKL